MKGARKAFAKWLRTDAASDFRRVHGSSPNFTMEAAFPTVTGFRIYRSLLLAAFLAGVRFGIRDRCPDCGAIVDVAYDGAAHCPDHECGWWTE